MGLKETFKSAAVSIVSAFGNVGKSVTYKSSGNSTYAPSTGTVTDTQTSYTVTAIVDENIMKDMKNIPVHDEEKLVYIPYSNLTPTPVIGDEITIDSVDWRVKAVNIDPADALWILTVERP